MLSASPEATSRVQTLAGGKLELDVGPRGRLVAVADGPQAMGFWLCDWCGHGAARINHVAKPPKHNHLLRNQPCAGPQRLVDLGHQYETDLLTVKPHLPGVHVTQAAWKSVMYALVEASCEVLEIARDEVGGVALAGGCRRLVDLPLRHRVGRRRPRDPGRGQPRSGSRGGAPAREHLRVRSRDVLLRLPAQLPEPA